MLILGVSQENKMIIFKAIFWLYRAVISPILFAIFGLGSLFLSCIWFNLLSIFIKDSNKLLKISRISICYSFKFFLFLLKFLAIVNIKYDGIDKLRSLKGTLIIANHPTLLDYVILTAIFKNADCMVKSSLCHNPFLKGVVKCADYILNNDGEHLIIKSSEEFNLGNNLIVFPTGTRHYANVIPKLQRGAAQIAIRTKTNIQVINISASVPYLDKKSKWYLPPFDFPTINVKAGRLILVKDFLTLNGATIEPSIAARLLTKEFVKELLKT